MPSPSAGEVAEEEVAGREVADLRRATAEPPHSLPRTAVPPWSAPRPRDPRPPAGPEGTLAPVPGPWAEVPLVPRRRRPVRSGLLSRELASRELASPELVSRGGASPVDCGRRLGEPPTPIVPAWEARPRREPPRRGMGLAGSRPAR